MSDTSETTSGATSYVILRFNADTDEWSEHGDRVAATSPQAAVRKHVAEAYPQSAHGLLSAYVAVPARSWRPVTVRAEQTVTLRIEEAT